MGALTDGDTVLSGKKGRRGTAIPDQGDDTDRAGNPETRSAWTLCAV